MTAGALSCGQQITKPRPAHSRAQRPTGPLLLHPCPMPSRDPEHITAVYPLSTPPPHTDEERGRRLVRPEALVPLLFQQGNPRRRFLEVSGAPGSGQVGQAIQTRLPRMLRETEARGSL